MEDINVSFCSFQTIWQMFWTLWRCRINTIYTHCWEEIQFIWIHCKTGLKKTCKMLTFLPVSKACTNIFFIFLIMFINCIYIYLKSIYSKINLNCLVPSKMLDHKGILFRQNYISCNLSKQWFLFFYYRGWFSETTTILKSRKKKKMKESFSKNTSD